MGKKIHSRVKSKANLKILKNRLEQKKKSRVDQSKKGSSTIPYLSYSFAFLFTLYMIYKLFNTTN